MNTAIRHIVRIELFYMNKSQFSHPLFRFFQVFLIEKSEMNFKKYKFCLKTRHIQMAIRHMWRVANGLENAVLACHALFERTLITQQLAVLVYFRC